MIHASNDSCFVQCDFLKPQEPYLANPNRILMNRQIHHTSNTVTPTLRPRKRSRRSNTGPSRRIASTSFLTWGLEQVEITVAVLGEARTQHRSPVSPFSPVCDQDVLAEEWGKGVFSHPGDATTFKAGWKFRSEVIRLNGADDRREQGMSWKRVATLLVCMLDSLQISSGASCENEAPEHIQPQKETPLKVS